MGYQRGGRLYRDGVKGFEASLRGGMGERESHFPNEASYAYVINAENRMNLGF